MRSRNVRPRCFPTGRSWSHQVAFFAGAELLLGCEIGLYPAGRDRLVFRVTCCPAKEMPQSVVTGKLAGWTIFRSGRVHKDRALTKDSVVE